jgi:hypothetical protein
MILQEMFKMMRNVEKLTILHDLDTLDVSELYAIIDAGIERDWYYDAAPTINRLPSGPH